jgi:hypothetical protein
MHIDLTLLHYVTFIEPHVIIPTESLSFGLDQFMNKSIDELMEGKTQGPFPSLQRQFVHCCTINVYTQTYM